MRRVDVGGGGDGTVVDRAPLRARKQHGGGGGVDRPRAPAFGAPFGGGAAL